jgi:hypothetical protein
LIRRSFGYWAAFHQTAGFEAVDQASDVRRIGLEPLRQFTHRDWRFDVELVQRLGLGWREVEFATACAKWAWTRSKATCNSDAHAWSARETEPARRAPLQQSILNIIVSPVNSYRQKLWSYTTVSLHHS